MQAKVSQFAELVDFPNCVAAPHELETHGTTVLALRYDQGVLMLADRRATAGNLIMYDQAEKILPLDDATLLAISGSFARSVEVSRFLKHSFKYYRRQVMADMSLNGKLMEISKALSGNMPMVMDGIGVFLPIVAAYDSKSDEFLIYFFDIAGARFQNRMYACAGSGSERIRGVFEYLGRSKKPWDERPLDDVLTDGLTMLDIAADLDSATGGFNKYLPSVYALTKEGILPIEEKKVRSLATKILKGT